jgi:hypothetical protein
MMIPAEGQRHVGIRVGLGTKETGLSATGSDPNSDVGAVCIIYAKQIKNKS